MTVMVNLSDFLCTARRYLGRLRYSSRFVVVLVAAGLSLSSLELFAHGGGDLIANLVPAGPYVASVWLNPPTPRAAEPLHLTIGLASPEDRSPVLDAEIMVELVTKAEGAFVAGAAATTEQSVNKLFYEVDLQVPDPGLYEAKLMVRGSEGDGIVVLDVDVQPVARFNVLWFGLAGVALVVILGWWRSRQKIQTVI